MRCCVSKAKPEQQLYPTNMMFAKYELSRNEEIHSLLMQLGLSLRLYSNVFPSFVFSVGKATRSQFYYKLVYVASCFVKTRKKRSFSYSFRQEKSLLPSLLAKQKSSSSLTVASASRKSDRVEQLSINWFLLRRGLPI